MIRVPYFEDESGLAHIFSPEHHNFTRQTSDSFCMMADDLERFFSPTLNDGLETGELAYGFNYDRTAFLWCRQVRQHLHFPHVVDWGPHALPTGERRHCSTHRDPIHSSHMCEKEASSTMKEGKDLLQTRIVNDERAMFPGCASDTLAAMEVIGFLDIHL